MWLLHLKSLEKLCTLFFGYSRLRFAQHVPEDIAKVYNLREKDSNVPNEFSGGNFFVKKNIVPFTSIGVDHTIQHKNRMMKVLPWRT